MIVGINKLIPCKVPASTGVETKISGGLAVSRRQSLTALEVLWSSGHFQAGSTLYVPSIAMVNQKWSTEVHEIDGQKFLLVPEQSVALVKGV